MKSFCVSFLLFILLLSINYVEAAFVRNETEPEILTEKLKVKGIWVKNGNEMECKGLLPDYIFNDTSLTNNQNITNAEKK